jgi:hypothetical protein
VVPHALLLRTVFRGRRRVSQQQQQEVAQHLDSLQRLQSNGAEKHLGSSEWHANVLDGSLQPCDGQVVAGEAQCRLRQR